MVPVSNIVRPKVMSIALDFLHFGLICQLYPAVR